MKCLIFSTCIVLGLRRKQFIYISVCFTYYILYNNMVPTQKKPLTVNIRSVTLLLFCHDISCVAFVILSLGHSINSVYTGCCCVLQVAHVLLHSYSFHRLFPNFKTCKKFSVSHLSVFPTNIHQISNLSHVSAN